MLKVSNETKVGVLTAISIVLLILGFNLLKGKSLFSRDKTIYAIYDNVQGVAPANPVRINGLNVGSVTDLSVMDERVGKILVTMTIQKGIQIPKNSVASIISSDLLGTKAVRIDFGNSPDFLQNKDTIRSAVEAPLTQNLMEEVKPLSGKIQSTLSSLDSVLVSVNNTLDTNAQKDLRASIAGLKVTMDHFSKASASLESLVANLSVVTDTLKQNNDKISHIMENADKTTTMLANSHIDESMQKLNHTMDELNSIVARINSSDGSLGLLINDKKLYNNLQATTYNLNLLMEDLRLNPKRYVHFSIFGKKDKAKPLPSDTLKQ